MRGQEFQLRVPKVLQLAKGHVQEAPLLVVLVIEAGLHHRSHEDGAAVMSIGEPMDPVLRPEALRDSQRSESLPVITVYTAPLVRLAQVGQQAHGVGAPGGAHVLLDALGEDVSPGHRNDETGQAPAGKALSEEVGTELQPHLRFQWLVLGEDPPGQGVVGRKVIQPVGLKRVGELGHVAGDVPEQHAAAVGGLHIHVALQTGEDVGHVRSHAFLPRGLWVVQLQALRSLVPGSGSVPSGPAATRPRELAAPDDLLQGRVVGGEVAADDLRPGQTLWMPEPHQEVDMGAAAAVVVETLVARPALPFAVLELDATEQIQHRAMAGGCLIAQHVARPASSALLVPAGDEAQGCLCEDVGEVKRLRSGQMQARLEGAQQLVLEEGVVGAGPFVRGNGHEKCRIAELLLQIQQSEVARPPILGGERLAGQRHAHLDARGVLRAAQGTPQPQIVDELREFVVRGISDDRRRHLR